MLKPLFIISCGLIIISTYITALASSLVEKTEKKPIVITSQSLTADNKHNTAVFEGSVVAKSGDIAMHADRMTVFYSDTENRVKRIHAVGNVKVNKKERALFSDEAIYLNDDEKIIFTGNPKAVEGENVITGTQIIFYIQDDRAVVEGSRVILQNKKGLN